MLSIAIVIVVPFIIFSPKHASLDFKLVLLLKDSLGWRVVELLDSLFFVVTFLYHVSNILGSCSSRYLGHFVTSRWEREALAVSCNNVGRFGCRQKSCSSRPIVRYYIRPI